MKKPKLGDPVDLVAVYKQRLANILGEEFWGTLVFPEDQMIPNTSYEFSYAYRHLLWLADVKVPMMTKVHEAGALDWMWSEHAAVLYKVKLLRKLDVVRMGSKSAVG